MGQLEANGSTTSEQLWAISKSSAVSGYGPTPCHQQCCFSMILGHQEAIGSISFKESLANSMPSALPTSLDRWANSKLMASPLLGNCGHQQVIGSIWLWANPMPSAVLLWNDSGPPGGHQQHLIQGELGQFHAISITYLF